MSDESVMHDIKVDVGGQQYAIACEDGQEARISELAAVLNGRFTGLKADCPGIADKHLLVMVGILLCDDIERLRQELDARTAEIASRERAMLEEDERHLINENQKAQSIRERRDRVVSLIERIETDGRF